MTRKHSGGSYHASQAGSITVRSECSNSHGEAEDAAQDGLFATTRKLGLSKTAPSLPPG